MPKLCLSVVVVLFLSGCANGHRYGAPEKVIVDTLGVDPYEYQVDLADCEDYAAQINVTERTVEGAVEGAVVGGVLGDWGETGVSFGTHSKSKKSSSKNY